MQYERVICPACNAPFFRDRPEREVCGVCQARLMMVDKRERNVKTDQRAFGTWPEGIRFEDAEVPDEPHMNTWLNPRRPGRSYFGASSLDRNAGTTGHRIASRRHR